MFKKILTVLSVFVLSFSFFVSAAEEFLVYGKDNTEIAKILNITESELSEYSTKNKITYFAINKDNTKQIRRTEYVDEFSQKAVDLSVLKDEEILKLSGDISGFSDVTGEIVTLPKQKFLKLSLETTDSGGEYALTQYITVSKGKKTTLTFYTAKGQDQGYIEQVFNQQFKPDTDYKPFFVIGIIVFIFIGAVVFALLIKDIKQKKE